MSPTHETHIPKGRSLSRAARACGFAYAIACAFPLALTFAAAAAAAAAALAGVPAASAALFEIPLPVPGDSSWKPLLFRSIERPTRFEVMDDPDGRPAFRATSDCGASALLLELPADFDLTKTPRLAWRWRVEQGIDATRHDEKTKAGDDFAARVYVLHGFDADRSTAWQRMEHKMGRTLFGAETPGETINYVWADQVDQGQSWTSPSRDEAMILALETSSSAPSSSTWREAIVDLPLDAARLFSPPPRKAPYAIGLMSDSDGFCQRSVAWFSDFRLLGPATETPEGDAAAP